MPSGPPNEWLLQSHHRTQQYPFEHRRWQRLQIKRDPSPLFVIQKLKKRLFSWKKGINKWGTWIWPQKNGNGSSQGNGLIKSSCTERRKRRWSSRVSNTGEVIMSFQLHFLLGCLESFWGSDICGVEKKSICKQRGGGGKHYEMFSSLFSSFFLTVEA